MNTIPVFLADLAGSSVPSGHAQKNTVFLAVHPYPFGTALTLRPIPSLLDEGVIVVQKCTFETSL